MNFIWKSSIILYVAKLSFLILVLIVGDAEGIEIGYGLIEFFSSMIFAIITILIIILTIIYKRSEKGFYYYYYENHKTKKIALIMGICIFIEMILLVFDLIFYSSKPVLIYFILAKVIGMVFVAVNGFTYIICKNDYIKKLEKQRLEDVKNN